MDLLSTAVVDITTLAATCHALKGSPVDGELIVQRKLRNQLRRDIKRVTVAYIDTLGRTKRGQVDEVVLAEWRVAAEQRMAHAMGHQDLLKRIMASEPGSLDGAAASRHDLWRLAQLAVHLRAGIAMLRESGDSPESGAADPPARRLRRRIRKALIAYARAILRAKEPRERLILTARAAALAEIGKRGAAQAERLADVETGSGSTRSVIRQGVAKPLFDLALDWQPPSIAPEAEQTPAPAASDDESDPSILAADGALGEQRLDGDSRP